MKKRRFAEYPANGSRKYTAAHPNSNLCRLFSFEIDIPCKIIQKIFNETSSRHIFNPSTHSFPII